MVGGIGEFDGMHADIGGDVTRLGSKKSKKPLTGLVGFLAERVMRITAILNNYGLFHEMLAKICHF